MFGRWRNVEAKRWWPRQRELTGEANGFRITGRYYPPGLAKAGVVLGGLVALVILVGFTAASMDADEPKYLGYGFGVMVANGVIMGSGLYGRLLWLFFGPTLTVIIEPSRIRIGSLFGFRNFPVRSGVRMSFERRPHPKAEKEAEAQRIRGKMGASAGNIPFYGKSVQVMLRYGEKEIVIASIYNNLSKAEALVTRFVGCMAELKGSAGR